MVRNEKKADFRSFRLLCCARLSTRSANGKNFGFYSTVHAKKVASAFCMKEPVKRHKTQHRALTRERRERKTANKNSRVRKKQQENRPLHDTTNKQAEPFAAPRLLAAGKSKQHVSHRSRSKDPRIRHSTKRRPLSPPPRLRFSRFDSLSNTETANKQASNKKK